MRRCAGIVKVAPPKRGWTRLIPAARGGSGFEVSLNATRTEPAGAEAPQHGVMLRGALRW